MGGKNKVKLHWGKINVIPFNNIPALATDIIESLHARIIAQYDPDFVKNLLNI